MSPSPERENSKARLLSSGVLLNDSSIAQTERLTLTACVERCLLKNHLVDDLAIIRTVHTEAINHDPAITYIQTGSQIPGRPSLGAWLSYGLGSMNRDLPHYVVMHAKTSFAEQSLFNRLWGSGFLPGEHQGCKLRSSGGEEKCLGPRFRCQFMAEENLSDRFANAGAAELLNDQRHGTIPTNKD